ncbi:cardiotoxin-6 [Trichinella spiralis]|uniref:cardiotoxin-6 n=1 Tax=Trichinella spiralis TaxID=6334 RepID=UPI0001EFE497|nr:cardiotoxin-6 [Trichinella spiralis]
MYFKPSAELNTAFHNGGWTLHYVYYEIFIIGGNMCYAMIVQTTQPMPLRHNCIIPGLNLLVSTYVDRCPDEEWNSTDEEMMKLLLFTWLNELMMKTLWPGLNLKTDL